MKSLHTPLGWLTLTAVLGCAGLALGQTGGIERVDVDTLQRAQDAKQDGTEQRGATQTNAAAKVRPTRADTTDAARYQYRHRWQKRSRAAGASQAAAAQQTGLHGSAGASRRAQAGGKSAGQSSTLRDTVRRRDRIHATAAGASKRDQARADERLRVRRERCSEAGEHRHQRRRAGGSSAAGGGGSAAGAARGGR